MIGNIGRTLPIKQAFMAHLLKGIDEIIPVTDEMRNWLGRPRETRAVLCADRMIDDVEKLLKKYHDTSKGSLNGIHAPVPVIMVAFSKDQQPIAPDRNRAIPNPLMVQLAENGELYKMRTDFIEQRIQVAFFAHTPETARAMTSQMRLYFLRYAKYRLPVMWQFGGYDFQLTAALPEVPASDDLADLADRSNLTVLTWSLNLECQIPYLSAPMPHELTDDGKHLKGYQTIKRVDLYLHHNNHKNVFTHGVVDKTPHQPPHGDWTEP